MPPSSERQPPRGTIDAQHSLPAPMYDPRLGQPRLICNRLRNGHDALGHAALRQRWPFVRQMRLLAEQRDLTVEAGLA